MPRIYGFLVLLFFCDTAPPEIYTLSLHDALPICLDPLSFLDAPFAPAPAPADPALSVSWNHSSDRKSTRLNSSHPSISYAVFCLKKKKKLELRHFLSHDFTYY